MPTLTITYETPEERRDYERAIAFVAEMRQLGARAPAGRVLDACEDFSLTGGQDFLREALAGAVQARVDEAEKKSTPPAGTPSATRAGGRDRS